jgi:hypothetical protein
MVWVARGLNAGGPGKAKKLNVFTGLILSVWTTSRLGGFVAEAHLTGVAASDYW